MALTKPLQIRNHLYNYRSAKQGPINLRKSRKKSREKVHLSKKKGHKEEVGQQIPK